MQVSRCKVTYFFSNYTKYSASICVLFCQKLFWNIYYATVCRSIPCLAGNSKFYYNFSQLCNYYDILYFLLNFQVVSVSRVYLSHVPAGKISSKRICGPKFEPVRKYDPFFVSQSRASSICSPKTGHGIRNLSVAIVIHPSPPLRNVSIHYGRFRSEANSV